MPSSPATLAALSLEQRLDSDCAALACLLAGSDDAQQQEHPLIHPATDSMSRIVSSWREHESFQAEELRLLQAALADARGSLDQLQRRAKQINSDEAAMKRTSPDQLPSGAALPGSAARDAAASGSENSLRAETDNCAAGALEAQREEEAAFEVPASQTQLSECESALALHVQSHQSALDSSASERDEGNQARISELEGDNARMREELEQLKRTYSSAESSSAERNRSEALVVAPHSLTTRADSASSPAAVRPVYCFTLSRALGVNFPKPLSASSGASVKQHIANLSGQVDALSSQLTYSAERKREDEEAQAAQKVHSIDARDLHAGGDSLVQLTQSASQTNASIERTAEANHEATTMQLLTTTQSRTQTSSCKASEGCSDAVFSTLSQQVTALSASSASFEDFVTTISKQIAGYHAQIHALQAQVEHLAKRGHDDSADSVQMQLDSKSAQLDESQRLVQSLLERMTAMAQQFGLNNSAGVDAASSLHFFASLQSYVLGLLAQHSILSNSLRSFEESAVALQAMLDAERLMSTQWQEEALAQRQVHDAVEGRPCGAAETTSVDSCTQTDDAEADASSVSPTDAALFTEHLSLGVGTDVAAGELTGTDEAETTATPVRRPRAKQQQLRRATVAPSAPAPTSAYAIHAAKVRAARELQMGPRWVHDTRVSSGPAVGLALPFVPTHAAVWEKKLRKPVDHVIVVPRV